MTYQDILSKKGANILLTGDSIAYNPQTNDPILRHKAQLHGVGMPSWSFRLRDRIYMSDPQFAYGDTLTFDCETAAGIDNDCDRVHTGAFGGRIQTLHPAGDVHFTVSVQTDEIVLYLQTRIDAPCVCDIKVDGVLAAKDVDTTGDPELHLGYSLKPVYLPCSTGRTEHAITFTNIRGTSPKITVAAVGAKRINITLEGYGGETSLFFLNHFEALIGQYRPDLMVISLGANDRVKLPPEMMRKNMIELFAKLYDRCPNCKVLLLLPPSSHHLDDPDMDSGVFTSPHTAETYLRVAERVCTRIGQFGYDGFGSRPDVHYDIEPLRLTSVFDGLDAPIWRFDNIHLNKTGNDLLLEAVAKKLGV